MTSRSLGILFTALLGALSLASCRQELCYDHFPTLDIRLQWEKEWERDYGSYHLPEWDADYFGVTYEDLRPGDPEWVNMIRYFDGEPYIEHYLPPQGEKYVVEADKESSILLYNGDTEYVVVSGVASLNDARATATTRTRATAALQMMYDVHQGSRTTNPPDIIYSAFISRVPGVSNHQVHPLPVKMQPLVYTYMIMYEFDYGIEHVALARGALGGVAESVYLRTGVTSDQTAIVLFDCDITAKGCTATVRSFGAPGFPDSYYGKAAPAAQDRPFTLNLELRLKNGDTVTQNFDITDQMKSQPRGGVIKITGLHIEGSQSSSSSGFDVDVTDWDDTGEVIPLPLITD